MEPNPTGPDEAETDVVVIGSGSAALTAALATSAGGLATAIVEKTAWIGGTSAMSGAGVWVPANHHARAAGIDDSPEDTLRYLRASAPPGWQETEDALWQSFAERAPEMLAFVEASTPLRFALTEESDPLLGDPGAKEKGRMLSPRPLPLSIVGRYRRQLRPPTQPHIFTYHEMIGTDLYHRPIAVAARLAPKLLWRWLSGRRGQGTALIAGLLAGCLDHGCTIALNARAVELITDAAGRVTGAVVDGAGGRRRITARRGVVLATGGFEWDREMLAVHFPGEIDFVASPIGNEGDGHRMAAAAGAALAHMDQANINPAIPSTYEGRPHGMAVFFHREANAILVDRNGHRFVDELTFNLGEVLDRRDPATGNPVHLPAWMISDRRFSKKSPVLRWYGRPDPTWKIEAPTLEALAERIGVPAPTLVATVRRYNQLCALGRDEDFHRGEGNGHGMADRRIGPGLEPIEAPPFVAIRFNRSILATKGGPRTNGFGQVLREDGRVIGGLYCAGVAMANPIGTRAVGAGTTLGPNMTWGYICGRQILAER